MITDLYAILLIDRSDASSYNKGVEVMGGKNILLWRYWPFWGLHFGVHLVLGVLGIGAGITVVARGELLNGLALCGAASFALLNGWAGYRELGKSKGNRRNAV